MPNGYHGDEESWSRLEQPLKKVDGIVQSFASSHNLRVSANERGWPSRELRWSDSFSRKITIALREEEPVVFSVGAVAWKDEGGRRRMVSNVLATEVTADELPARLESLLKQTFLVAMAWTETDLKDVGKIG